MHTRGNHRLTQICTDYKRWGNLGYSKKSA
jgi:hypothetical protein